MAVVKETPVWVTGITQIDPNDPVQGGPGGVDNVPHEQLANRTAYLKQEVEGIKGETTEPVTLESLLQRIKDLEEEPAITVPVLPIGATVETTVVYTSGTEFAAAMGYGDWEPFAQGRVTVGVSSKLGDPDWTKVIGNNFGEYDHTLDINQMPTHNHDGGGAYEGVEGEDGIFFGRGESGRNSSTAIKSAGGGKSHNNTQPSTVVGKWVRTA